MVNTRRAGISLWALTIMNFTNTTSRYCKRLYLGQYRPPTLGIARAYILKNNQIVGSYRKGYILDDLNSKLGIARVTSWTITKC